MSERLEDDLRAIGVRVTDPPSVRTEIAIDEGALERELLGEVAYGRKDAAAHDAMCLSAVHMLREGQEKRTLENAGAIFMTTNSGVVRTSRKFFNEQPRGDAVPIAALDYEVGTVVWLKTPQTIPTFPRHVILADAFAALNPPDGVWDRYMETVEHLVANGSINEDDYALLRYSSEARRALMSVTRGNPDAFTAGTVDEVLETARRNVAAEYASRLSDMENQVEAEKSKRIAAEEAAATDRAREQEEHRQQVLRVEGVAERIASVMARGAFFVLAVLATASLLLGFFLDAIAGLSRTLFIGAGLVVLVGLVLSVRGLLFGDSIAAMAARLEVRIATQLKRILLRMFGPGEASQ
jgi:hypothetical protein